MHKEQTLAAEKLSLSPLARFWRFLAPEKREILLIVFYAFVAGMISIILPLGLQAIVTYVSLGQATTSWVVLVGFVVTAIAAAGILQIMQLTLAERIQQRIFTRSAFELAYRAPRIRNSALYHNHAPEIMNRFFDTVTIQKGMAKILLDVPASAMTILISLFLLCLYHPVFIVFSLLFILSIYFLIRIAAPASMEASLSESKYKYRVAHWLEEIVRVVESFKLTQPSSLPLNRTDELVENYLVARKKHFRIVIAKYYVMTLIKILTMGALLIIGSLLVMNGGMNLGQFVATELVLLVLISSAEKLILSSETVYDILTGLEKIGSVTDLPLDADDNENLQESLTGMKITAENLTWVGSPSGAKIESLNLNIMPGDCVLLTGDDDATRIGMLRLISGIQDDFSGQLNFDGVPLSSLNDSSIHSQIGATFALNEIFYGTIADNISMGRESIGLPEIIRAGKLSGLDSWITQLKDGYHFHLIPDPGKLSPGLARRILLARAFAGSPRLLLLSNPFMGMSEKDASHIAEAIESLRKTCTVLISADQKPSGIKFTDVIEFKMSVPTVNS
jgi:ABC-type bacteriocin/lantibiotic exporter with double-glycine peptidase domain